jgi:Vault protein inter-alpha-trypsin domain/von Willebrand factor type A domain
MSKAFRVSSVVGGVTVLGATIASGYLLRGKVAAPSAESAPPTGGSGDIVVESLVGRPMTTIKGKKVPIEVAQSLGTGTVIRTDGGCRVRLRKKSNDGQVSFGVPAASEVVFSAVPEVKRGVMVLDAESDTIKAETTLPLVRASSQGGKYVVTSANGRDFVRSLRGRVEVIARGRSNAAPLAVEPGQEAVITADGRIEVASAPMMEEISFRDDEPSQATRGIGKLVARKPGQNDEKERAVTLVRHDVRVRAAGALARTEIEEVFRNDTDDVLEGVYRFPLPDGAQMERLALDVDGKLVEGEFVERERAGKIWKGVLAQAQGAPKPQPNDIIWVPGPWRDPALLEWSRSGQFELKIFPIPKRGTRRVVMAYTEHLPQVAGERRYTYPLPSRVEIPETSFDFKSASAGQLRVRGIEGKAEGPQFRTSQKPSGSIEVAVEEVSKEPRKDAVAWAHTDAKGDHWVTFSLTPKFMGRAEEKPRDHVLVLDASLGMTGERMKRAMEVSESYVRELDRRDRVTVLSCALTCQAMKAGFIAPGIAGSQDVKAFAGQAKPHGAFDALSALREAARKRENGRDLRITLLGSGTVGAGYRMPDSLYREVTQLAKDTHVQITTVAVSPESDSRALEAIARGGAGAFVSYQAHATASHVAQTALLANYGRMLQRLTLQLPEGVTDVSPRELPPIRSQEEVLVSAKIKLPHLAGDIVIKGEVGGEATEVRVPIDVTAVSGDAHAFVPRIYAESRIKEASLRGGDATEQKELIELSKAMRVPSPHTSLLVLESEAMFQAFGVTRSKAGESWTGETAVEGAVGHAERAGDGTAAEEETSDKQAGHRAGDGFGGGGLGLAGGGKAGPGLRANAYSESESVGPSKKSESAHEAKMSPQQPKDDAPAPMAAAPVASAAPVGRAEAMPPPRSNRPTSLARRPPPQSGQWMRRTWVPEATLVDTSTSIDSRVRELEEAKRAVEQDPNARAKRVRLAGLALATGERNTIDNALREWSEKDPFDADLVMAQSEALSQRGEREQALETLSGLLSVPNLGDAAWIQAADRLAVAFERAGNRSEGCAFRVAAADLRRTDVDLVAKAVRCQRQEGAPAMPFALEPAKVSLVEAKAKGEVKEAPFAAALTATVEWDSAKTDASDLDVVIVLPSGERRDWTHKDTVVRDAQSMRREQLGFQATKAGTYRVELIRSRGASDRTISGTAVISSYGKTLRIPFVLHGRHANVGQMTLRYREQLVPADGWGLE